MSDPTDLSSNIATNAQGPREFTTDGTTAQQHSLPDQIAADRYLKSQAAAKVGLGIRRVRMIPPSAADVDVRDCP